MILYSVEYIYNNYQLLVSWGFCLWFIISSCIVVRSFSASHYTDVIMGAIASQITSLTIVYSTVYSDADKRKHHGSTSLAFVWGIHRGPVNSPHKWPVTRKMFSVDEVIMAFRWTADNLTEDNSILFQLMPWCHQVSLGNKSLPESVLTLIQDAIWRH